MGRGETIVRLRALGFCTVQLCKSGRIWAAAITSASCLSVRAKSSTLLQQSRCSDRHGLRKDRPWPGV